MRMLQNNYEDFFIETCKFLITFSIYMYDWCSFGTFLVTFTKV